MKNIISIHLNTKETVYKTDCKYFTSGVNVLTLEKNFFEEEKLYKLVYNESNQGISEYPKVTS